MFVPGEIQAGIFDDSLMMFLGSASAQGYVHNVYVWIKISRLSIEVTT